MKFSVKGKLLVLLSGAIILGVMLMAGYSAITIKSTIGGVMQHQLESDMLMGERLLDETVPGVWSIQNNKLMKGDKVLNDDTTFVDKLGTYMGNSIKVTIFQGDDRISSNIVENGKRAVGTKAPNEVKKATLEQGETFSGNVKVIGQNYYAIYKPIQNKAGETIGMLCFALSAQHSDQSTNHFVSNVFLWGTVGLLLIIGIAYFILTLILRMLKQVNGVAREVAKGNLGIEPIRVRTKDEFGELALSMNDMVLHLKDLVGKVNDSVHHVSDSSRLLSEGADQTTQATLEISETMQRLAAGTETQSQAADDCTKVIDELASGIQRIAAASGEVFNASSQMSREAEEGNRSAEEVVQQMDIIATSMEETAVTLTELNRKSEEIEQTAWLIQDIATQTNLLALNASIEAARAGEQVRGFAVVAGEVRKLAQQAENSAMQIGQLVELVTHASSSAAESMIQSKDEFVKGAELVVRTAETFSVILTSAGIITRQIEDVSCSSQEMSAGTHEAAASVEQIAGSVKHVAAAVQSVAAATEEELATVENVSEAARRLSDMARELENTVHRFTI